MCLWTYMIDLLLTASCYKSAASAVRLLKSVPKINGKCLAVITSPRMEDLRYIERSGVRNVVLFLSKFDNMYYCRNWGFIWAYMSGIVSRFYCSMDDDIEFTDDSVDILERLDRNDYAVMTFNNKAQYYRAPDGELINKNLAWVNGDSMFTHTWDNFHCGLPDCSPRGSPMPYFVETEYQLRLSLMLGKPIIADTEKEFYIHHHRDDPQKLAIRSQDAMNKMKSGLVFLSDKYGIKLRYDINNPKFWLAYKEDMAAKGVYPRHLLYPGLGVNYDDIYNSIESDFTQIYLEEE